MPCPREKREAAEALFIGPHGLLSTQSTGRLAPEPPCEMRTCFQRDVDRITHSKSFRRLKHKTQVFLRPEGDHYRTRLTHTLEVSRLARTVTRALALNEDLAEAASLGHDLGHTPFGHAGERALNKLCPGGFKHYQQSVRVVDKLEKNFQGLNLTWEVRNGIICHTKGKWAATLEGQAVRYADRIAYMNHDIEDAITAGVLSPQALPTEIVQVLGDTKSRRISTLIQDLVANSGAKNLSFSPLVGEAYEALHDFMYSTVYVDKDAKREEQKVEKVIAELYERMLEDPGLLPDGFLQIAYQEGADRAVTDYISGMSDEFAIHMFEDLFVPKKWHVL